MVSTSTTRQLSFSDNDLLREVAGELGAHLKLIAKLTHVEIAQRGSELMVSSVTGDDAAEKWAMNVLTQLYGLAESGQELRTHDVQHAVRILGRDPTASLAQFFTDTIVIGADNRPIVPRSAGQRLYVDVLRRHEVSFGVGPAGTGKTYLAMAVAVAAIKRGDVKRIILTRPAVEAGEKLGFLPGDLNEKVDPYLRPLWDALNDMIPADRVARMLEKRVIEVAPLAFMRGRTLRDAYVVLDEAQNTTREQMKMFLTRLGQGSRMVITGDVSQVDLPRPQDSGMLHALRVLEGVPGIGVTRLASADVVRHPLVAAIVDAYAEHDAQRLAQVEGR